MIGFDAANVEKKSKIEKVFTIISLTVIFVLAFVLIEKSYGDIEYGAGKLIAVESVFDADAVQEYHIARFQLGRDTIEINVLSNFEQNHKIGQIVPIKKTIGKITKINYGFDLNE